MTRFFHLDPNKKCVLSAFASISVLGFSLGLAIQQIYFAAQERNRGDCRVKLKVNDDDQIPLENLFINFLSEGKMYIKNVSYTDSLVILQFQGDLYKLHLESDSVSNLSLSLERLERESYFWTSDGQLEVRVGVNIIQNKKNRKHNYSAG